MMVIREEVVRIDSGGISLQAVLCSPITNTAVPALVICHGAFEYKERYLDMARFVAGAGIGALVPDMRGHGDSGGERFEIDIAQWIQNIKDCIDYLIERKGFERRHIAAFGLSTGGTAVLEAAMIEPRLAAIITYAATVRNVMTLTDMLIYFGVLPIGCIKKALTGKPLTVPMADLVKGRKLAWDAEAHNSILEDPYFKASFVPIPGALQASWVTTIHRAATIAAPVLVMHGEADEVDEPLSSVLLFEKLTCAKKLVLIPEMGHVASVDRHRRKMYEQTVSWIRDVIR